MRCPDCWKAKRIESRLYVIDTLSLSDTVIRTRDCLTCGAAWRTEENLPAEHTTRRTLRPRIKIKVLQPGSSEGSSKRANAQREAEPPVPRKR